MDVITGSQLAGIIIAPGPYVLIGVQGGDIPAAHLNVDERVLKFGF